LKIQKWEELLMAEKRLLRRSGGGDYNVYGKYCLHLTVLITIISYI